MLFNFHIISRNSVLRLNQGRLVKRLRDHACFFRTNLYRHIAIKHKAEEVLLDALTLLKRGRCEAFARMRKEGISKHNRAQMKAESPIYESKRSRTQCKNLVHCGKCLGLYSKDYFAWHRKLCMVDLAQEPKAMPLDVLAESFCNLKEIFKTEILACFAKDTTSSWPPSDWNNSH